LNKNKDLLRNLLGTAKPQVLKFIAQKKKPVMSHSVVFSKNGEKVTAAVRAIKEPFVVKEKWPAKFTVLIGAGKKATELEAVRYKGGKFLEGDDKQAIPIETKTVAKLTSRELVFKLRFALDDTKNLIDGIESPRPDLATDGLLKEGERLIKALTKIGQKK
ncbi:MAG: formin, partial [Deltaproteobacteria bacterium]